MSAIIGLQVINGGGQLVVGSTEFITVLLTNLQGNYVTDVPIGTAVPLGPPASVQITLQTPSGQQPVAGAIMTPDANTFGYFNYTYKSMITDERGPWLASFNAADGTGNIANFSFRTIFIMRSIFAGTN